MTKTSFSLFAATLAVALLGAAWHPAQAQPKPAQLVPVGSEIAFTTRQMGVPVEGRFGKFSAQITLDPKKPEAGSVAFTIDTGSARFGSAELDAEVPKATWLNAAKFPQATFQSGAIKAAGAGKFEVTGKLSIKGSVRDVTVPVQVVQSGNTSTASGTAKNSTYSAWCAPCAARLCQAGIGSSAGGRCVRRQSKRAA
ncbi:MAG: YceI family protein, partial [Rubrivivax sp.]|nr:YceI family protein [Rubrivivax sp.]